MDILMMIRLGLPAGLALKQLRAALHLTLSQHPLCEEQTGLELLLQ